jgi:molybdopterin-guanine dinucleotide biosynthesis protein A
MHLRMHPRMDAPLCGLFVGGRARRMGGIAKGLLPAPDGSGPLVARLVRHAAALGLRCVLVGDAAAYGALGLPALADDPPGIGPLGGLRALLLAGRPSPVLALACDMPYVSLALLQRLWREPAAGSGPPAAVTAARRDGRWEPLCARYAAAVLPVLDQALAAGERSFQALLRRLPVHELVLSADERAELRDWDSPGDMVDDRKRTGP